MGLFVCEDPMRCLCCKSERVEESFRPYFASFNDQYIIVEHVPCQICQDCGEVLFSVSVMERVEEMIRGVQQFVTKVCIMEYSHAA